MDVLFKNGTANIKSALTLVGIHTVTSAEATANTLTIDLSNDMAAVEDGVIQIKDSGNNVVTADADITFGGSAGTVTIADGSTLNLTAGYTISYIVFGSASN